MESHALLMSPSVECSFLPSVDMIENIVKCFNNNQLSHILVIQRCALNQILMRNLLNSVDKESHPLLMLPSVNCCFIVLLIWLKMLVNASTTIKYAVFLQYSIAHLFIYVWQSFGTVFKWNLMHSLCGRWLIGVSPGFCEFEWKERKMLEQGSTEPYSCNSTLLPY